MSFQRDFRRSLDAALSHLDADVSDLARERMTDHYGLLRKWAPKVNLTTVLEPEPAARLHFVDSLLFAELIPQHAPIVLDVGSGAGFPGVPLASIGGTPMVLLEPLRKRCSFLRVVVAELGLHHVRVVEGRAEPRDRTGLFPTPGCIVSRATLPPAEWLELAPRSLAPGASLVLSSGRGAWSEEEVHLRAEAAGLVPSGRVQRELGAGHHRTLDRFRRPQPAPAD